MKKKNYNSLDKAIFLSKKKKQAMLAMRKKIKSLKK
jgi:hypothetical protein